MKRRREAEMVPSVIRSAVDELSSMVAGAATAGGATPQLPLKSFLSLCYLLLQVLDRIGPTMAVLRNDIHQNIQRLENFHDYDPSQYWDVIEILKQEMNDGNAKNGHSCSKAFVWLTRSLEFSVALLGVLVKDFERKMEQIVEESYNTTLRPWHGWISSAAYKIALRMVPDSHNFVSILKATDDEDDDDTLKEEIINLIALLTPMLEQNMEIMRIYQLDKMKST